MVPRAVRTAVPNDNLAWAGMVSFEMDWRGDAGVCLWYFNVLHAIISIYDSGNESGRHSLGGSMAASYVAEHVSSFEGLVLLGSYSTADLSESDLSVLSICGSEDRVLNREK